MLRTQTFYESETTFVLSRDKKSNRGEAPGRRLWEAWLFDDLPA